MNKSRISINLIIVFSSVLLLVFFSSFAIQFEILAPKEIEFRGVTYLYSLDWKEDESLSSGNLDNDLGKEVIISFGTYYNTNNNRKLTAHFIQIYKIINGDYKLIKTIKGCDYPGRVLLKDFNQDNIDEIVVFSHKKSHYAHIYIYQWKNGDYSLIWDKGSYCGVEIDLDAASALIKVASSDLSAKILNAKGQEIYWCYAAEPLWEVYSWDGNTFSYRQDLSTAEPLKKMH